MSGCGTSATWRDRRSGPCVCGAPHLFLRDTIPGSDRCFPAPAGTIPRLGTAERSPTPDRWQRRTSPLLVGEVRPPTRKAREEWIPMKFEQHCLPGFNPSTGSGSSQSHSDQSSRPRTHGKLSTVCGVFGRIGQWMMCAMPERVYLWGLSLTYRVTATFTDCMLMLCRILQSGALFAANCAASGAGLMWACRGILAESRATVASTSQKN